jgi:hypothetical protein
LTEIRTLSLPQKRLARIYRMISLLPKDSVWLLRSLIKGAMKTGDSKHMASSFRNLLLERKFRFGKSMAKLMYFSFSLFSIKAVVLLM